MQYDENAEKYGYEGEMTPIECDELKAYCEREQVDKLLAEKDREIALLKERICNGDVSRLTWIDDCIAKDKEIAELKADVNNALIQNQELCQALQVMYSAEEYMELQDENTQLKQKLEDVQASMYADVVDANMEIRRLKDKSLDVKNAAHVLKAFKFYLCQLTHCAYDERTAQWIIDNWEQDYKRIEANK